MIELAIITGGILVWHIASELLNRSERQKMLNRLMARTYQEYEYFNKEYPGVVKDVEKVRKKELDKEPIKTELDAEAARKNQEFLDAMDEEWDEDIIDQEKLTEVVNELEKNRTKNTEG